MESILFPLHAKSGNKWTWCDAGEPQRHGAAWQGGLRDPQLTELLHKPQEEGSP